MQDRLHIAFFGSSLVSAYWNGAATYYRGIIRALAQRGHRVTFYEPDALGRQQHRDMADPDWARVVVYSAEGTDAVRRCLDEARREADLIVKASGVGVFDELLEEAVPQLRTERHRVAFWDVDAPATLARLQANPADPLATEIGTWDMVLTYGGGEPVVEAYLALGARSCTPIYNAFDPTTHHPTQPDPRFECDLALMANRLPDREARIGEFFFDAARRLPDRRFVLGGSGWGDADLPANVRYVGHVYTHEHNAFNVTPRAVLNVNRESMASNGYSPATRVFEVAAAGGCLISDAWAGMDRFFEPGKEVLIADSGAAVAETLAGLDPVTARRIGSAARRRATHEHTYDHRARELEAALNADSRGMALPGGPRH